MDRQEQIDFLNGAYRHMSRLALAQEAVRLGYVKEEDSEAFGNRLRNRTMTDLDITAVDVVLKESERRLGELFGKYKLIITDKENGNDEPM